MNTEQLCLKFIHIAVHIHKDLDYDGKGLDSLSGLTWTLSEITSYIRNSRCVDIGWIETTLLSDSGYENFTKQWLKTQGSDTWQILDSVMTTMNLALNDLYCMDHA
jgi:hypothetical protein